MPSRLKIVFLCYSLSSFGILTMLNLIGEAAPSMEGATWIAAWAIHLVMSVHWVRDVKLSRRWPLLGAIFGSASFFLWAFAGPVLPNMKSAVLTVMTVQFVLVAPCVLLACWLLRFHWTRHPLVGDSSS
ncbi:MAG: hypothetical protein AB1807_17580 [Pseudomonadota bacterium]